MNLGESLGEQAVELHPAFLWTCDACGQDNFVRSINLEPEQVALMVDPDLLEQVMGVEGGWSIAPDHVVCNHCGGRFAVAEETWP